MATTLEDYYSSEGYTPDESLIKKQGSDPKYWFMGLQLARSGDVNDWDGSGSGGYARKLQQAKERATDKGMDKWSVEELRAFLNANFSDHVNAYKGDSFKYNGTNYTYPDIENANQSELFEIAAALTQVANYSSNTWDRRNKNFADYSTQIDSFNKHREVVGKLAEGGGTVEQISTLLGNETFNSVGDYDTYLEGLNAAINDDGSIDGTWLASKMDRTGDDGKTSLTEWGTPGETGTDGGGDGGVEGGVDGGTVDPKNFKLDDAKSAVINADDRQTTLNTAVDNTFLGESSIAALKAYADENENISYRYDEKTKKHYLDTVDESGNTVDKQEFAVDKENNQIVYVGGEKAGQRFSKDGVVSDIQENKGVEDTSFQNQQNLADEISLATDVYNNYLTTQTGGTINEGVAESLGWTKNDATGEWTDDNGTTYSVNENGELVSTVDGTVANTVGQLEEDDFAGQINKALNSFLNGPVDENGNRLTDEDGNPIPGFLETQQSLVNAGETLQSELATQDTAADEQTTAAKDAVTNYNTASQSINGYYDPETGEWVEGSIDELFNQVNDLNTTFQESSQAINGYYDPETGEWVEGSIDKLYNKVNDLNATFQESSQSINGYYDPETGEWVEGSIDKLYNKVNDLNATFQESSQSINGYYDPETGEWVEGSIDKLYNKVNALNENYQQGLEYLTGKYNPETGEWEEGLYDKAYKDLTAKTQSYQDDLKLLSGYRNEAGEWVPGEYDNAYRGYEDALNPLTTEARRVRNQLGDIGDLSLRVANDANNPNYYSRLQDLYYQDAKDTIDRTTRGARDSLNQQYAQAGLDPSSPAYTAAMMDLQNSRADALRSSRRQSILDSYGLGSEMLGNRQSALTSAANTRLGEMSGLNNEMNALDSLYGVRLEGLNARQDMIGKMYNIDRDLANQEFNMYDQRVDSLGSLYNTSLTGLNAQLDQQNNRNTALINNYNTALTGLNTQLDQQNNRNTALINNYNTALTGLNTQLDQQNNRNTALTNNYNTALTGLNTQLDQQNNRNTVLQNQRNNQFDLINLELDKIERKKNLAGTNFDISKSLADIQNSGLTTQLQTLLSGIEANQLQTNANRDFNLEALTQRLKNLGLEYDVQGNIRLLADQEGDEARDDLVEIYTGGKSDLFNYATLEEMAKQRGETLSPWIIEAFGR